MANLVKGYIYNLGCANLSDIYEDERKWLNELIRINELHIDPDTEKYLHVGFCMNPKIDKHSWVTCANYNDIEWQIKLPLIDGNKCFMPVSIFKGYVENDIMTVDMPCLIRRRSSFPNTGIVIEPSEGYIELEIKLSQLDSQFYEMGPFEDAIRKVI